MKVFCPTHGAHFPEDFKPRCPVWGLWGLEPLSTVDKKKVWDWVFALNIDEIAIKYNIALETNMHGVKLEGDQHENEWVKYFPEYASWSDNKRKRFQRNYFKNGYPDPKCIKQTKKKSFWSRLFNV